MKKILLFSGLLFFATSFFSLKAQTIPEVQPGNELVLIIQFRFITPEIGPQLGYPRSPIVAPEVGQVGHTLYFFDETPFVLNLYSVDEDDDETLEYSTAVSATTTEVQLPDSLSGTYIIEVVRGEQHFRGEIEI